MPRAQAAFRFHLSAIQGEGGKLMGMHAANEGFVRAFARHADVERHYCIVDERSHGESFARLVQAERPQAKVRAIDRRDEGAIAEPGCGFWMDPQIARPLWRRRAIGPRSYSICGLTHTVSSVSCSSGGCPITPRQIPSRCTSRWSAPRGRPAGACT